MNRIVFWLAVLGLAFLVWRFVQLAQRKQQRWRDQRVRPPAAIDPNQQAGSGRKPNADPAVAAATSPQGRIARGEAMLRCAQCGVYLPESEAIVQAGKSYCSAEHRDAPAPK